RNEYGGTRSSRPDAQLACRRQDSRILGTRAKPALPGSATRRTTVAAPPALLAGHGRIRLPARATARHGRGFPAHTLAQLGFHAQLPSHGAGLACQRRRAATCAGQRVPVAYW